MQVRHHLRNFSEYLDEKAFKSIYDENCQLTAMLASIVKSSKTPKII